MAKKKRKKKAKKRPVKAPKKTKKKAKKKVVSETIRDKIARIRERIPYIKPTGECLDEGTKEVLFRFTEAQQVFRIYRTECEIEGLIWRPYCAVGIQPVVISFARGIHCLIPFCIEDIKTGEIVVGWGSGGGSNADWSGNTAHTRALKQFLLTTFQATWDDPEHLTHTEQKTLMRQEVLKELESDGTLDRIQKVREMTNFFGTKPKGVTNEDSRGKNPKRSTSRSNKKNRTGTKRHSGRSRTATGKKSR